MGLNETANLLHWKYSTKKLALQIVFIFVLFLKNFPVHLIVSWMQRVLSFNISLKLSFFYKLKSNINLLSFRKTEHIWKSIFRITILNRRWFDGMCGLPHRNIPLKHAYHFDKVKSLIMLVITYIHLMYSTFQMPIAETHCDSFHVRA